MRKAAWVASRQLGGLRTIRYSHFRERSCSNSAKKRSCFWSFSYGNVTKRFCFPWGLLARWHFAIFGDCASLKATFRVDAFYELMLYLLLGEVDVKGKNAELTERFVWSCLFLHTYNNPSAFLGCRVRDLLDSEAGGDALSSCSVTSCRRLRDSRRRSCRHDSRSRSCGRRSFGENRRRNWDDYSLNNVVYNAGSIVKYMYCIARYTK